MIRLSGRSAPTLILGRNCQRELSYTNTIGPHPCNDGRCTCLSRKPPVGALVKLCSEFSPLSKSPANDPCCSLQLKPHGRRACHPVPICTSGLHEHALSSLSSLTAVGRTPYRCDLLCRSNLHHLSSGMCAFLNVINPVGLTPRTTMRCNVAPSSSPWPVASRTLGFTQQSIFAPFYIVALWIS
jgi:hypothetical protein